MNGVTFASFMGCALVSYISALYIPVTYFPQHDIWHWLAWVFGWTAGLFFHDFANWIAVKIVSARSATGGRK